MSCTGTPRRRSSAATSALPARACHGQTSADTGRRRPTARSARPSSTAATSLGSSRRVERAVRVEHADQVGVGGQQAGVHGGAVPASRLVDDPGAVLRPRSSGEPSVEPLSTTMAGNRAAARRSTAGSAAASSRHGSTTSIVVCMPATLGPASVRRDRPVVLTDRLRRQRILRLADVSPVRLPDRLVRPSYRRPSP